MANEELGRADLRRADADLLGVYEHLYDDNFGGQPGISTHYVVLRYKLRGTIELASLPDLQHTAYRWATVKEITTDATGHLNTQLYFVEPVPR
ncbi:hypothetical protein [Paraburkholderia sp. GAS348]|uniref:hypothetical protein n=1 Tax=Paraburkholderia sp. GAS348 TaxID=3035132 RepID=UPI003D2351EA